MTQNRRSNRTADSPTVRPPRRDLEPTERLRSCPWSAREFSQWLASFGLGESPDPLLTEAAPRQAPAADLSTRVDDVSVSRITGSRSARIRLVYDSSTADYTLSRRIRP